MRIILCPQELVKKHHLGVETVLDVLGFPEALVTDESVLWDFEPTDEQMLELRKLAYGVSVVGSDYLWEVGKWIEGD